MAEENGNAAVDYYTETSGDIKRYLSLFIILAALGTLLSAAYVPLNFVSDNAYLSLISAAAFAAAMAYAAFKLRGALGFNGASLPAALTAVCAFIAFSYFKWSLYFAINRAHWSYWDVWQTGGNSAPGWLSSGFWDVAGRYLSAYLRLPGDFFRNMRGFNLDGTWSVNGIDGRGAFLLGIWVVETAMLLAPMLLAASGVTLRRKAATAAESAGGAEETGEAGV